MTTDELPPSDPSHRFHVTYWPGRRPYSVRDRSKGPFESLVSRHLRGEDARAEAASLNADARRTRDD